jgi:aldose sugar dehydrogenase
MRRALVVAAVLTVALSAPAPAASNPRPQHFATTGDLVEWAYVKVLGRSPDPGGLSFWRASLDGGGDPVAFLDALLRSGEADAWIGQVIRAYRSAYGRAPDADGLRFWLGQRANAGGRSFREVSYSSFVRSPEFDAKYGGTSDDEFVRRIYVNALGRAPDANGQAHWVARLRSTSRPQIVFEISESAEHRARRAAEVRVTGAYVTLLNRLPDAGAAGSAEVVRAIWSSPELAGRLATVPTLSVSTVLGGLQVPWGLAFAPDGTMLVTQRPGVITVRLADGTSRNLQADLGDLFVGSEGGLLDLALDRDFGQNRRFYTCQNRRTGAGVDVAVIAWTVDAAWRTATRVANPLLGGIPATSGRHSGCRIAPDPFAAGVLLVATGDAAIGSVPQDLSSLGGKLLRISATTGEGVPGNPFFASPDPDTRRILEWGHRNLQGLAVHPGDGRIVTAEHGPDRDDEVNRVVVGGNFGWNPQPGGYNEAVPMTDLQEFPNAVGAVWSSGSPTVATSGTAWLDGCQWGAYDDHLAIATLRGAHLRILGVGGRLQDLGTVRPPELDADFGRLRTAVLGPDGALYLTTANGSNDRVLRVAPSGGRCAA